MATKELSQSKVIIHNMIFSIERGSALENMINGLRVSRMKYGYYVSTPLGQASGDKVVKFDIFWVISIDSFLS